MEPVNRFRKYAAPIAAVVMVLGLAVGLSSAPAAAAPVVPVGATWAPGLQAYVVDVKDMATLDPSPTYKVPVVEVYRNKSAISAQFTACPTGTASQPNSGRFCAYMSTGFNGNVYMWNWQWKNKCVPVGAPFDNDVESFAVGFPDQGAQLSSGYNCSLSTAFQTIGPLSNDSNLSPYNNYLSSFFTFD